VLIVDDNALTQDEAVDVASSRAGRGTAWTVPRILALIGESERGDLEFKGGASLAWADGAERDKRLDELSKDISGMANADGGVMIYGMAEKDGLATNVDGVDVAHMDAERLENLVLSSTKPPIAGLHITPVKVDAMCVYVLVIPRSPAGCQARDKRYYRRRNLRVDMLEDWEVRELMNRAIRADAEIVLAAARVQETVRQADYRLTASIRNLGAIRIREWKAVIDVPTEYLSSYPVDAMIAIRKGNHRYNAARFTSVHEGVIFPGETVETFDLPFIMTDKLHNREDDVPLTVDWILHADDMPAKQGSVRMRALHDF